MSFCPQKMGLWRGGGREMPSLGGKWTFVSIIFLFYTPICTAFVRSFLSFHFLPFASVLFCIDPSPIRPIVSLSIWPSQWLGGECVVPFSVALRRFFRWSDSMLSIRFILFTHHFINSFFHTLSQQVAFVSHSLPPGDLLIHSSFIRPSVSPKRDRSFPFFINKLIRTN